MDEESKRNEERLNSMGDKYLVGKKNSGGSAYNILSLQYDKSTEGEYLKQRDYDGQVRALMRSKNLDVRSNTGHNIVHGGTR